MASAAPILTVAIPAYNRPEQLGVLLESVLSQDFDRFETLVVEDRSPRRAEIEATVRQAAASYPQRVVRYETNPKNLGYDGNLRRILTLARGEFTLFMGDDDILKPGALARVASVVEKHPNLGVILRAYEHVDLEAKHQTSVFRYFATDRYFPPGVDTIRTFFRRSVSIAGYTIHTTSGRAFATDRFDGSLLYQLYLSANVLAERAGYYISDVLTSMRWAVEPHHFFGSAESEQGLFRPGALTPEHSLNFMRGMLEIAKAAEDQIRLPIYEAIVADLSNYSYPVLRLHAKNRRAFARYIRDLAALGLGHSVYFWGYSGALFLFPAPLLDRGIYALKQILPSTPRLGNVYAGEDASRR